MKPFFNQALVVSEAYPEDKPLYLHCLSAISLVHHVEGNYAEARYYLDKAIFLAERFSNAYLGTTLGSLGQVLLVQGKIDEAQSWLEKALAIMRKEKNLHVLANILITLGGVTLKREDYSSAQRYLEEAVFISRKLNFQPGIADSLAYLGQAYTLQNKFKDSQLVLLESLNMYLKSGAKIELWYGYDLVVKLLVRVWSKIGPLALLEQISCLLGAISEYFMKGEDWGVDKKWYEQGLEVARTGLGEAAFEEAFARGQKLSQEEKVLCCQSALKAVV